MTRIVASLAVCLAVALAAPAHAADAVDGKALYAKKCTACHGADGKGTAMGKNMGAKDISAIKDSEATIAGYVKNGKGKMPAVKNITDPEAQAIAKYVKGGLK